MIDQVNVEELPLAEFEKRKKAARDALAATLAASKREQGIIDAEIATAQAQLDSARKAVAPQRR